MLALSARPGIRTFVVLDERSAGFQALGMGKVTAQPAAVVTTSGTAVAELLAPIVEASYGRVPLIAVTADRPRTLEEIGANQTIKQDGIFNPFTRYEASIGPDLSLEKVTWIAAQAYGAATGTLGPPGPVHINVKLDEPLNEPIPVKEAEVPLILSARRLPDARFVEAIPKATTKVAFLAGQGVDDLEVLSEAGKRGWVVFAGVLSGLRTEGIKAISCYELAWRADKRLVPDLLVLAGEIPATRSVQAFIGACRAAGGTVVRLEQWLPAREPTLKSAVVVEGDLKESMSLLIKEVRAEPAFSSLWEAAEAAVTEIIEDLPPDFGGRIARELFRALGPDHLLYVSSSLPIRYLEAYSGLSPRGLRVLSNRGASGIDGVFSSAVGAARASLGNKEVVAFLGDLAFFHDLSAHVGVEGEVEPDVTIVVHLNGGGGIFEELEQAESLSREVFRRFFLTPASPDPQKIGQAFSLTVKRCKPFELREVLADAAFLKGRKLVLVESNAQEDARYSSAIRAQALRKVVDYLQKQALE